MIFGMSDTQDYRPDALADRFAALLSRCGLADKADVIYRDLYRRYSESHRKYHDFSHIRHCIAQLDEIADQLQDPDAVELALWFHDAIYDVRAQDNEYQSAILFDQLIGQYLPKERARKIYEHIMVTVHPSRPEDQDAKFVVDIDLSSFGVEWEEFERDSDALREESGHLSDSEFARGKIRFLQKMLEHSNFYLTDYFRERFEVQALSNIQRHLVEIRSMV